MSEVASDECSFLWEILRSSSFHITYCLLAGMGCLLPLCLQLPSHLELKPLRTSVLTSAAFTYSCVASIALVIPLFLDVVGDLLSKSKGVPLSVPRKKRKAPGLEETRFTFLNASERSLILLGMIALPSVAFLPSSTEKLALIFVCCCKCQIMLVGGTIVISLCRYDKEYWSVQSTLVSLALFSCGLVSSAFLTNHIAGIEKPSEFLSVMDGTLFLITIIPCLIYTVNSFRWLIIVYCQAHFLKRFLMCSCDPPQQLPTPTHSATAKNAAADHTFFPMVYTISTIAVETLLCATIGSSQRYEDYSPKDIIQNSIPFQGFLILITTLSMRMVKFEVVQGLVSTHITTCSTVVKTILSLRQIYLPVLLSLFSLKSFQYALIESKKSYVRYISHELRTPLNSAFLGIFTGNIT